MLRSPFFVLLLFAASPLAAQWDGVYRRGLTLSLEVGLEQEPEITYNPLVPLSEASPAWPRPRTVFTLITENKDSLAYGYESGNSFRDRPDDHSQRYNLQLRLEKKMLSGLEFGGGLFLSEGRYSTRLDRPDTPLEDFAYGISEVDYLKLGFSGSMKFHLFRIHRLQPYLGIQALFLYERTLRGNQRVIFSAYQREELVNVNDFIGPNAIFALDLRLLIGLDYPLTKRLHLGLNATTLGAAARAYAGMQLKYLLSDY